MKKKTRLTIALLTALLALAGLSCSKGGNTQKFLTEEITLNAGTEWELGGTLTLPEGKGPFSAVVLVQGSGPSDRDETIPPNKPFKDIAEFLSGRGIAVLRYDKRSYIYGQKLTEDMDAYGKFTVSDELIDDTLAATALLRADPRIDPERVYLLGHSLGGMTAPRIDAQPGGDYAGIIILAGTTRSLEEVLLEQLQAGVDRLKGDGLTSQLELAQSQLDEIKAAFEHAKTLSDDESKGTFIAGASAWYFRDLDSYPSMEVLKALDKPILILQGSADFQIYPDRDYKLYQEGLNNKPNVTFKLYDNLNHLFMPSITGTATDYSIKATVNATVLEDIAAFVTAR